MAKSVENPPKFQPLKDNYERFMDVLKRNKDKRLPAVDETIRERVNKYKDKEFLKKEIVPKNTVLALGNPPKVPLSIYLPLHQKIEAKILQLPLPPISGLSVPSPYFPSF